MRQESGRLARHRRPGGAAVSAAIDAVAFVGDTDIDGLGRIAGSAAPFVECHPDNPLDVAGEGAVRVLEVCTRIGEVTDFRPGHSEIGAPPEAVAAARPEVEDVVAVWIDRQAFAHST